VSTGADYSEEYRDPHSGAAIIGAAIVSGKPAFKDFVASMKPTDTKPRTQFNYQSVNTQVLGLLLEKVTGHRLNQYTEEKPWKKIGAQSGAFFYEAKSLPDICAFACFNATIRDCGRVGLMMMRGRELGSERVVPESWVHESTNAGAAFLKPGALGEMVVRWEMRPSDEG
jgi:CubicO group peptidase (beta-lactamase class C family)